MSEDDRVDAPVGRFAARSNDGDGILAAALACFHLGNGAMLPLYSLAVVGAGKGNPALFTATTVVVAQGVMIVTSLIAMKVAAGGCWCC